MPSQRSNQSSTLQETSKSFESILSDAQWLKDQVQGTKAKERVSIAMAKLDTAQEILNRVATAYESRQQGDQESNGHQSRQQRSRTKMEYTT